MSEACQFCTHQGEVRARSSLFKLRLFLGLTSFWTVFPSTDSTGEGGGGNPNKRLSPPFNLKDFLHFFTYRNSNFIQYPAFFLQCPRTMSHVAEKFWSLPIPGKISRFPDDVCFSPETALLELSPLPPPPPRYFPWLTLTLT